MIEENLTPEQRAKEIKGKLSVINNAYEAGQIKIYKVARYQGKTALPGITIYRIKYIVDNKAVYDGAYDMKKDFEAKMIEKTYNIDHYILLQLATQL